MVDVNEALAKITAAKTGTSNKLQDVLKDMPMAAPSKGAKSLAEKRDVKAANQKKDAPMAQPVDPVVKRATRAVKQVKEHNQDNKSNKTTRLALRDVESGEFASPAQAARDPDAVATDFVSLPKKAPAKKAVAKKAAAKKAPAKRVAQKGPAARTLKKLGADLPKVPKKATAKKSK